MTQKPIANISEKKIKIVSDLVNLLKNKKTILLADISNIPGSQYQSISKKLRGKAIVKLPKKNLFFKSIEKIGKKGILELKNQFKGSTAVLSSDLDSYDLAAELLKIKSPSKAKTGQIAPRDIEIPAGPTDLIPGPAISELGALGIQIMIKGGKIEIKEAKVVAQEGKPISKGAAEILSKLNILPFTIGFTPVSSYDAKEDIVYLDIKIDTEGTKEALIEAYARALPFAVSIGYYNSQTIPLMIQKAGAYEKKLIRVITGEPEEVAPVAEEAAVTVKEEIKQEKKKEEPVSFGSFF
jgi:large subunit ribosomal protein L10